MGDVDRLIPGLLRLLLGTIERLWHRHDGAERTCRGKRVQGICGQRRHDFGHRLHTIAGRNIRRERPPHRECRHSGDGVLSRRDRQRGVQGLFGPDRNRLCVGRGKAVCVSDQGFVAPCRC